VAGSAASESLPKRSIAEINESADLLSESSSRLALSSEAGQGYVQLAVKEVASVFTSNKNVQSEVGRYGSGFLMTAALFMPGKIGLASTVVLGALDHASPNSTGGAQMADLALGGFKGAGLRGIMHGMGSKHVPEMVANSAALKGVAFGFSNRALETVLTRQSYLGGKGNISGAAFGGKFAHEVVNPTALVSDAATFVAAHALFKGAARLSPQLFERSVVAQTMATSASFGLSNGASAEIIRQQDSNEKFDLGKIIGRSLIQGGIDALAGAPGGMRARSINRQSESDKSVNSRVIDPLGEPGEVHSTFARSKNSSHVNIVGENDTVTRFVQVDKTPDFAAAIAQIELNKERKTFIGPLEGPHQTIRELTIPERSLAQQPARVTGYKTAVEKLNERSEVEGPFNNFDDFYNRGIAKVPTDVRTYSIDKHTVEVVLPTRYAEKLDDAAAKKSTTTTEGVEDFSKRVGPADLPPLLDAMPNSGYFKRIFISDKRNPEDAWVSQGGYNKDFVSAMSMTDGELNMYKTERTNYLRRDVLHEWSHELRYQYWDHNLTWRFADAINLEAKEYSLSKYADRNNGEQWAVLGERMLGNDAKAFVDAAEHMPIRTVIWMRALKKSLDTVPAENKSVDHDIYVARQNYVDTAILPQAVAKLEQYVKSGTSDQQSRAADVLQFLREEGLIK